MKNVLRTKNDTHTVFSGDKKDWANPKYFRPMDKPYSDYHDLLSPMQKKIFRLIYDLRYSRTIRLKRETIASRIGCTIKTVSRAIARFDDDYVIVPHQWNPYAVNQFIINPPKLFQIKLAKKKSKK